jgi:hypothetical protein
MGLSELDKIVSPDLHREIEMRLELWQAVLGNGLPEDFLARARCWLHCHGPMDLTSILTILRSFAL